MDWIKLKLTQYIISVVLIIILFALIFYNIISKLHLIHFILIFIYFYQYSHSVYFHDHGAFNLIGLFVVLFISLIILLILQVFLTIFKYQYKYKFISILFLIFFYNVLIDPINCDDWPKGLNNTYIENDKNKYGCQIIFPKSCSYKIIAYTQDISKFWPKNCKNKNRNSKEKILKFSKSPYINSNTLKFGFPLTNNDVGKKDGIDDTVLKEYTSKYLIDMDKSLPLNLDRPEYIVDFSKDPLGEVTINLNFNETLSKERKKLEINSIPYSNNILLLYIDSVSRANALRKMKKTISFIDQFISYQGGHNKKNPNENFHSFQFFKYHSHKYYTVGNFPILFYGNHRNASNKHINLYLKRNGFVTCYAADNCYNDFTVTFHNFSSADVFDHHYSVCDPNFLGPTSKLYCDYNKIYFEYVLEYANQFLRKYNNNQKFLLILSNFAHEGSYEKLKYIDNIMYQFFYRLFNDNLLKETSLFLLSDHGVSVPSIYYLNEFYRYERVLPMFYILVNDRKNIDYESQYKYLNENQQSFITGFDIYNTIINLIFGDKYGTEETKNITSKQGQSLFSKINSLNRSPKDYSSMDLYACI